MQAALDGKEWWTRRVTDGTPLQKKDAAALLRKIAEGTWICGDPGLQYDGAIQKWHTCKGTEPIHSTNPCSEYVFLNNTACNLASLNLMKFKREDGEFDIERFKAAVRIFITAQEIIVDNASYPTTRNRRKLPHLPHPRPGLRQSRLPHHELRPALRFRRRPRPGRRRHRHHDRPRLRAIGPKSPPSWAPSTATATPVAPTSPQPLGHRQRRLHPRTSSNCIARPSKTSIPAANSPISRTRRAIAGTAPWSAARNPATATPRSPSWPPPAPSPSSWIATPPASSRTSPWSNINCSPAAACLKIVNRGVADALRRLRLRRAGNRRHHRPRREIRHHRGRPGKRRHRPAAA